MSTLDSYGCVRAGDGQLRTEIENELYRLRATGIALAIVVPAGDSKNDVFKLSFAKISCGAVAAGLCEMLKSLPDASGERAVIKAIRRSASRGETWAMR